MGHRKWMFGVFVALVGLVIGIYWYSRHHRKVVEYYWQGFFIRAAAPNEETQAFAVRWGDVIIAKTELEAKIASFFEPEVSGKGDDSVEAVIDQSQRYYKALAPLLELVVEKTIQIEAKRDGLSRQEWIQKKVGEVNLTPEDFKAWLEKQSISETDINPSQLATVKEHLKQIKERRMIWDSFAGTPTPIEVFLQPPSIELDWTIPKGVHFGKDGSDQISLFCDLKSTACFEAIKTLEKVVSGIANRPAGFDFLPIQNSPDVLELVRHHVLYCLSKTELGRLSEYIGKVRALASDASEKEIYNILGLSKEELSRLKGCVVSADTAQWIETTQKRFSELGLESIPTLIVEGEPITGIFDDLRVTEVLARRRAELRK